jgi:hypothetical protein
VTAQMSETLLYEGQKLSMMGSPLGEYFSLSGYWPPFRAQSTALWRGYVGTWEVREGRLYLIAIRAQLEDGTTVTLETLFPGYPDRVFAHWFTGELRVPQGRVINYVHQGYQTQFQADLFLYLEKGMLISTELVRHVQEDEPIEETQGPTGAGSGLYSERAVPARSAPNPNGLAPVAGEP